MKTKEQKQKEAAARQAEHDALSTEQKLEKLCRRGHGHCKEAKALFFKGKK